MAVNVNIVTTLEQICICQVNQTNYTELWNLVEYFQTVNQSSIHHCVNFGKSEIIIPTSYRKQVLQNLHAAHQGTSGMLARANQTVYWPGMHASVRN